MTEEFIKTFVILLAIIDPIGNLPIYMALTAKKSAEEHKKIAVKTCCAVVCLLTISFLAGKYVILFFGIQMSAFNLVGGIFLVYVAFTMLTNSKTTMLLSSEEIGNKDSVILMPLTFRGSFPKSFL